MVKKFINSGQVFGEQRWSFELCAALHKTQKINYSSFYPFRQHYLNSLSFSRGKRLIAVQLQLEKTFYSARSTSFLL